MKKTLLFISFAFVAMTPANAQITITSSDVASPLKTVLQRNDTMPTISIGNSGPAQTWNLSALNTHTTDTMYFTYPSWTTGGAQFPSSNLAIKMKQQGQDAHMFAINNSSSLTALGYNVNLDLNGTFYNVTVRNTPAEAVMNYPATYNSTFTSNYVSQGSFFFGQDPGIGFTIDSIRLVSTVNKTVTCDGWGSVTTPLGTNNALRTEVLTRNTDVISAYNALFGGWFELQTTQDSTKKYEWWANGIGFTLASVTVDWVTEIPTEVVWLPSLPSVGVNEYTSNFEANAYPNPAQNTLTIATKASEANSIQIFDTTGRLVKSMNVNNDLIAVDVSELANGIYTYTIIVKDNSIGARGKFSVVK